MTAFTIIAFASTAFRQMDNCIMTDKTFILNFQGLPVTEPYSFTFLHIYPGNVQGRKSIEDVAA